MPQWEPSRGWPARNITTPKCCSHDVHPVTASGRGCCSKTLRPSRDNSACGRSRHEFQTSAPEFDFRTFWTPSARKHEEIREFDPRNGRIGALQLEFWT